MTKFYDSHIRGPRGGWSYPIGGTLVAKYSEADIVAELKRWRTNNGTFVSDEKIEEEIWAYYCTRQPERCGLTGVIASLTSTAAMPRELTKEVVGPWLWQHLNLFAARWQPGIRGLFLDNLDTITLLLECPICRNEWRALLEARPPANITTRFEICQWVWWAHEQVNQKLGKNPYPYSRAVLEFGFPPLP